MSDDRAERVVKHLEKLVNSAVRNIKPVISREIEQYLLEQKAKHQGEKEELRKRWDTEKSAADVEHARRLRDERNKFGIEREELEKKVSDYEAKISDLNDQLADARSYAAVLKHETPRPKPWSKTITMTLNNKGTIFGGHTPYRSRKEGIIDMKQLGKIKFPNLFTGEGSDLAVTVLRYLVKPNPLKGYEIVGFRFFSRAQKGSGLYCVEGLASRDDLGVSYIDVSMEHVSDMKSYKKIPLRDGAFQFPGKPDIVYFVESPNQED